MDEKEELNLALERISIWKERFYESNKNAANLGLELEKALLKCSELERKLEEDLV